MKPSRSKLFSSLSIYCLFLKYEFHLYWLVFGISFYCTSVYYFLRTLELEFVTYNGSVFQNISSIFWRNREEMVSYVHKFSHMSERLPITALFSVPKDKNINSKKHTFLYQKDLFHHFCLFIYCFIHLESAVCRPFGVLLVCFHLKWKPDCCFLLLYCTFFQLCLFVWSK